MKKIKHQNFIVVFLICFVTFQTFLSLTGCEAKGKSKRKPIRNNGTKPPRHLPRTTDGMNAAWYRPIGMLTQTNASYYYGYFYQSNVLLMGPYCALSEAYYLTDSVSGSPAPSLDTQSFLAVEVPRYGCDMRYHVEQAIFSSPPIIYDPITYQSQNDIAMVKLKRRINFGNHVCGGEPVERAWVSCDTLGPPPGTQCIAVSYGELTGDLEISPPQEINPNAVPVLVQTYDQCETIKAQNSANFSMNPRDEICVQTVDGYNPTCYNDNNIVLLCPYWNNDDYETTDDGSSGWGPPPPPPDGPPPGWGPPPPPGGPPPGWSPPPLPEGPPVGWGQPPPSESPPAGWGSPPSPPQTQPGWSSGWTQPASSSQGWSNTSTPVAPSQTGWNSGGWNSPASTSNGWNAPPQQSSSGWGSSSSLPAPSLLGWGWDGSISTNTDSSSGWGPPSGWKKPNDSSAKPLGSSSSTSSSSATPHSPDNYIVPENLGPLPHKGNTHNPWRGGSGWSDTPTPTSNPPYVAVGFGQSIYGDLCEEGGATLAVNFGSPTYKYLFSQGDCSFTCSSLLEPGYQCQGNPDPSLGPVYCVPEKIPEQPTVGWSADGGGEKVNVVTDPLKIPSSTGSNKRHKARF